MLAETGFLCPRGVRCEGIIIVVQRGPVLSLSFATGGCTKSIQLGRQLRLGLDERATVISHRLIAVVGILREEGESGSDKNHQEKNESKDCIVNKENHTHDTSNHSLETWLDKRYRYRDRMKLTG